LAKQSLAPGQEYPEGKENVTISLDSFAFPPKLNFNNGRVSGSDI
jgi:hypothetical protein